MSSNNMSGFKVAGLGAAMNRRDKADLINAFKKKLQAFVDNDSDVLENLSPAVRNRVKELQGIQAQYDDLEAKFLEERASLEAKYQKLYEPFYIQRYEVVSGKVEVEGVTGEVEATEKGVPNFWLNAMKNNDILAEEITKRDEGPLKFLVDIKWSRVDNPEGFRLDFHFDTNPFFKNSVLTKTYHMLDEDEPILDRAIGTEIEWYPGKCVTHKIFKKKPKKGADITEPIIKIEACESFFNFFSPTGVPEEDKDIEENDVEELDIMEQDYDIGATIRDEIIPHAVSWFTGEAAEDEFYEDEDEDADEEEDEEDEDEKVTEKKGGMAPVGEGHQG